MYALQWIQRLPLHYLTLEDRLQDSAVKHICTVQQGLCHAQSSGLLRTCIHMHSSRSEQGWPPCIQHHTLLICQTCGTCF